MKSTALACAFMLSILTTVAQDLVSINPRTVSNYQLDQFPVGIDTKPLPGFRQRNTGRALTVGGLALITGGLILMNSGPARSTHPNVTGQEPSMNEPLGFMMVTGGIGMSIPGVILWKKGSRKYRRSLEREGLAVSVSHRGWKFSYSF